MYIRTQEEALAAVAEILDLPQRRDQIVQSTIRIMLCLEAEPRRFLCDCQALLVDGGLEALSRKRRELVESIENAPVVVLDPEDDRLFEATASALDALRFAAIVPEVFPGFLHVHERWVIARAILAQEAPLKEAITAAIRARKYVEEFDPARMAVEAMVISHRPAWIDRAARLRSACLDALRRAGEIPTERLEEEAETVFGVLAASDERALELLNALEADPAAAGALVLRAYGLVQAVRSIQPPEEPNDQIQGLSRVA